MLSPGVRLGPYEILAPLGAGGMGEVFRARDTRLGRQVAVKVLPDSVSKDPHRIARFETEARALAALSHPNILGIHDFGQSDGRFFTVTELLEGETLRDRMGGEPLAWRKAVEIAASIADALAAAHTAGIVHRDLKPENVFVTSDGRVKVLDFGLARVVEAVSGDAVTLTSPAGGPVSVDGEVVGTLLYMAPEQLRGLKVDGRSDLFALGCVLYEMLSGRRPFGGTTPADIISEVLRTEPPPLESTVRIPPALGLVVSRCLEKRPEDRFDTAHDLSLSLRGLSTAPGLPALRAPTSAGRVVAGRGTRIASTVSLVGLALVGTAILTSRTQGRRSEPAAWGPPTQITSSPGWDGEPALSPDGTLVAYSSNASGRYEIWVVDTEGGEPLRLTDDGGENRNPVWFPDGRTIAFVSTLGASSVRKVSRLGGSTNLIVENADTPAVSPDGTSLAFSRVSEEGLHRIWVAPISEPSKALQLTGDDGGPWDHVSPAWSPDGTHICYAAFQDLWVVPTSGGKPEKLTRDGIPGREPVYSPDGNYVYFAARRGGGPSLWRVSSAGGNPERALSGTGTARFPTVSRDGRRLVFASYVRDMDVVLLDRRTATTTRIATSMDDESPTLAPDGSAVAFVSNRLGRWDLWIQEVRDGRIGSAPARRLTTFEGGGATPTFAPDGQTIAFFRPVKGHREIWALPLNGGAEYPLVQGAGDNLHPAYAPDMSRLAFVSDRSGALNLWVVPLRNGRADGVPWPVTTDGGAVELPVWAPDCRSIAFLRGANVWIVDVRPKAEARSVLRGAGVQAAAFEPDGSAILAAGLFGTPTLHLRRVSLATGLAEPLRPPLALGDRNALGSVSVSRDGRLIATDMTTLKGNLWMTTGAR